MKLPSESLKQFLVASGFITANDFDDALQTAKDSGKKIEDVLVFRGLISEEGLGKLIAEHLGVSYANIKRQIIPDTILTLIPEKLARNYRVVPFAKDNNNLSLAMEDPSDFEALEFVKRHTGLTVIPYFIMSDDLRKALGQYKRNIKADFNKVISENIKKTSSTSEQDLVKLAGDLPIVKILDTLLEYAVSERASDIHAETLNDSVVIRFRVDGILRDIMTLPREIQTALVARIKILSNLKIDEHRTPQDGRYKFTIDEDVIALRISIIPSFYGENVVIRLLAESNRPSSLEELGLTGKGLQILKDNITKPHGMILVTGPTGSGKTTTLYSVLNILNTTKVNICTIEDPVEYAIRRINQIQVNSKTGLTFALGLRALLRHDPNIIMVGEIRDKETAEIAVHSALTGHLVLSTLHTNDAPGAIPRFLDMGVEGFLVASTINVVIAQRLVRKICVGCLSEYTPDQTLLNQLSHDLGLNLTNQKFYKGQGCPQCNSSGYSGRIGIYEVLSVTEGIRKLVSSRKDAGEIAKQAISEGMERMMQDGLNKVAAGLTTIEEVMRVFKEE